MTRSDITGGRIAFRHTSESFRENFYAIFGKPESTPCDCIGGKVNGRPCPVCCPTDDGPGKDEK